MDSGADPDLREALREMQRSLARIAGDLSDVALRVDKALEDKALGDRALGDGALGNEAPRDRALGDRSPGGGASGADPDPGWMPPGSPDPWGWQRPTGDNRPHPTGAVPARPQFPPSPLPPVPPAPRPPASLPVAPHSLAPPTYPPPPPHPPPPHTPREPGSWADTAGLKVLGWVGGGVTVLGIVLLLVIAAQSGGLSPTARVVLGLVLGVALVAGGVVLHRDPQRAALAVTIACTGLAVEYLTVVGAVRLADLAPPAIGYLGSAVIVAVAVLLAVGWRAPWLAGAAFLASGLLAMVVGGGVTDTVLVFEAIMVAGGAACLLLGVGLVAWCGAGAAAAVVCVAALASGDTGTVRLLVIVAIAAVTWATVLIRHLTGAAAGDPGPFPLRAPSQDPAQVARDYADFHEHQRRRRDAGSDALVATVSLGVSAALLLLACVTLERDGRVDAGAALIAAALALVFAALAWAGHREPALRDTAVTVTAWSMTIALVALATLRAMGGDARGPVWVVVAALALAVAAGRRTRALLWPALIAAALALLSTSTVMRPSDLLSWQGTGLMGAAGLDPRAWTVVLPTGLAILVMCGAAFGAIARCTRAVPDAERITLLTWSLVGCVVVGIYGILAVTMVLAYAVSPTEGGYQSGQVAVTVLIVIAGLLLLWQGFRQVVLRLGGLALAALAVGKLLLLDTRSLSAMPRAVTFIGVGVLLLASAVAYLRATSRSGTGDGGPAGGAQE